MDARKVRSLTIFQMGDGGFDHGVEVGMTWRSHLLDVSQVEPSELIDWLDVGYVRKREIKENSRTSGWRTRSDE